MSSAASGIILSRQHKKSIQLQLPIIEIKEAMEVIYDFIAPKSGYLFAGSEFPT